MEALTYIKCTPVKILVKTPVSCLRLIVWAGPNACNVELGQLNRRLLSGGHRRHCVPSVGKRQANNIVVSSGMAGKGPSVKIIPSVLCLNHYGFALATFDVDRVPVETLTEEFVQLRKNMRIPNSADGARKVAGGT